MTRSGLARRTAIGLVVGALAILGVREFIHSRYQILGDSISRIDIDEKVVALYFDDGPNPKETPLMLDLLDRHRIRATFFMIGRNIERFPDTAREVLKRGHELGNHSYSHPRLIFMSPARVRDELERTDALLRGVGVTGPIPFSAPHGAKFIVLPYVLRQMNKLTVYSDPDPKEWKRPPAATMVESVMSVVGPGSAIGFHDTAGEQTRLAVNEVVTRLRADGYAFETVTALAARRR